MKLKVYDSKNKFVCDIDNDEALLGSYHIDDGSRIHVIDKFVLLKDFTATDSAERYYHTVHWILAELKLGVMIWCMDKSVPEKFIMQVNSQLPLGEDRTIKQFQRTNQKTMNDSMNFDLNVLYQRGVYHKYYPHKNALQHGSKYCYML